MLLAALSRKYGKHSLRCHQSSWSSGLTTRTQSTWLRCRPCPKRQRCSTSAIRTEPPLNAYATCVQCRCYLLTGDGNDQRTLGGRSRRLPLKSKQHIICIYIYLRTPPALSSARPLIPTKSRQLRTLAPRQVDQGCLIPRVVPAGATPTSPTRCRAWPSAEARLCLPPRRTPRQLATRPATAAAQEHPVRSPLWLWGTRGRTAPASMGARLGRVVRGRDERCPCPSDHA
jgi:hypothetical protein